MTDRAPSAFGELLRLHRARAGLTQESLAELAGLSARGIADLERGARRAPYPSTIERLVEALQLSAADCAALRAAGHRERVSPSTAVPARLPAPLTSFVGRERDVDGVLSLLGASRLLTLTGPGGIGKTRLAFEVARRTAARYADGVVLVELASLGDPGLTPHAVATALAVPEQPNRPLIQTLTDALRSRCLLLVLDNCEHLVAACAELVERLLHACPDLHVLTTSREPLGVSGEQLWPVPPLSLPSRTDPNPAAASDAARLFVERAQAALPDVALDRKAPAIAAICQRLDGLPLALELAAARVRALSVEQIAEHLDHALGLLVTGSRTAPARQRTLRATFDWSYGLLTAAEQRLLPRLALFAGGWTLEAAESVCADAGSPHEDVALVLAQLVDKSLVVAEVRDGHTRYRLLETIRAYAAERLEATGDATRLRRRHAEAYVALTEAAEPHLHGPNQIAWLNRLEQEHDNLRTALRWALQSDTLDLAVRLAGAAAWFWFAHGHFSEGRHWTEAALSASSQDAPRQRAKLLFGLGVLAQHQDDYARSNVVLEESLGLARQLGDGRGAALALLYLGRIAREQGDYTRATQLLEEAVAQAHAAGDAWPTHIALQWLGSIAEFLGEYARAEALLEESLIVARNLGAVLGVAYSLRYLGRVLSTQGRHEHARSLLEESLALSRELGDRRGEAWSLHALGLVARGLGEGGVALACQQKSLALRQQTGELSGIAECLEAVASIARIAGQPERAAQLFGAADRVRASIGAPLSPIQETEQRREMAAARAKLGSTVFAKAWAAGEAWSLEEAVGEALSIIPPTDVPTPPPGEPLTARER